MHIFKAEQHIAEKILNNKTISFIGRTIPSKNIEPLYHQISKADTSLKIDDLFFHDAILVSSNWNKNDDIFLPEELWAARRTPIHKPTNLNHDELEIVGHMFASSAVDNDYNFIQFPHPNDSLYNENVLVDELPELFHLLVSSVIYTRYENSDKQEQVDKLIADIKDGKMFVSMECAFLGFDYALTDGETYNIVTRNKETASLSQYLKCFGGSGSYENKKIGRILRNIHFTGKGYTPNPANEYSVILHNDAKFSIANAKLNDFSIKDGVFYFCKANSDISNNLGNPTMNEEEIKKLQSDLEASNQKVIELTTQVTSLTTELEAAKKDKEDMKKKHDDDMTECSSKLEAKIVELEASNQKIMTLEASLKASARVQILLDGGFDKSDASVQVEKFAGLSDTQFNDVASALIEVKKAKATSTNQVVEQETDDDDDVTTAADTAHVDTNTTASVNTNVDPNANDESKLVEFQTFINNLLTTSKK